MSNENIEDIYPLSPTQTGMYFHHLQNPQLRLYFNQYCCSFKGELDSVKLSVSWQQLLDNHPILRSCFLWQGLEKALQVVHKKVTLPWQYLDWQAIPGEQQAQQLEKFMQSDRQQGIALEKAPVLRIALIKLGATDYRMIWSFHHLILDRWSVELLLQQLYADYFNAPTIPTPPVYRDYINYLLKLDSNSAKLFWQQYLAGFQHPTKLDTCNPILPNRESGRYLYSLANDDFRTLQQTAKDARLTMNTLFQGAWAKVLSSYNNTHDVLFGNTVSGRPTALANVENMVGLFINTLPVRIILDQDSRIIDWLTAIQHEQINTQAFEQIALVDIQANSEIPANDALFDTLLVFENIPARTSVLAQHSQFQIEDIEQIERSNYPLAIIICPGKCLEIHAIFDQQIYQLATIQNILHQLSEVLNQICKHLEKPVASLSLLSEIQRQLLLEKDQHNSVEHKPYQTIQQLVHEQLERKPDHDALVFADQRISYHKLNSRANQVANLLLNKTLSAQIPVAIVLPRGPEYIIAIFACLKVGTGYLPLDPAHPSQRLYDLLADANSTCVISNPAICQQLDLAKNIALVLTTEWHSEQSTEFSDANINNSLAYQIYTSGSTGKPKGVKISQQNLLHSTLARLAYYPEPVQRFLLLPSFSFDSSVAGLFWTLVQGGTLTIPEPGTEKDPQQLGALIATEQITHLLLLPSLYQLLLEHVPSAQLSSLTSVIVAGENCPCSLPELHYQCLPETTLYNEYGPTEATVWSSVYKIPRHTQESPIAIGQAITNTQIYLLDVNQQPVAFGLSGEIVIAGPGVTSGYHQDNELTATKFIANPFADTNSNQLYKTGDLGRYRADGNIEFLGRIDDQIKFLGYRIEPGEIQLVLNQYPGILNSVVIGREHQGKISGLVAYIVTDTLVPFDKNLLQTHLQKQLPPYMIPSQFIELTQLPLTANGKLNKKALPNIDDNAAAINQFAEPSNTTEQQLAEIWQQLFNTDLISIDDDFFELGGHSLLAVALVDKISTTFQKKITLESIWLDATTVRTLAAVIDQQQTTTISAIKPVSRKQ